MSQVAPEKTFYTAVTNLPWKCPNGMFRWGYGLKVRSIRQECHLIKIHYMFLIVRMRICDIMDLEIPLQGEF